MVWTWRYEDPQGGPAPAGSPPAPEFPTQADAESWLGESWRELVTLGVSAVTLLEDGAEVYGPMSLHPAD